MLKLIRTATLTEIESLLIKLGRGNHEDNMNILHEYPRYFLVELSKEEFYTLIFLQNDHVFQICPRGEDRSLRSVAQRALKTEISYLHANWDLAEISKRSLEHLATGTPMRPLILRDARPTELRFGKFYIQDGCHTALGYAMTLLSGLSIYSPTLAYLASNQELT